MNKILEAFHFVGILSGPGWGSAVDIDLFFQEYMRRDAVCQSGRDREAKWCKRDWG